MLTLVGLNHRSAPLEVRERLAMSGDAARQALERLREDPAVREAFILSTCNRVEFLVRGDSDGATVIDRYLATAFGFDAAAIDRHTYRVSGLDAVRHLFRVTAGLDSMILGEPQIHGQVKAAFHASREAGTSGIVLDRLLQHALSAAKRARTETGISRHAVSVAYAAVQLAIKIFGSKLDDRRVLMLGAGKMGELVARHLARQGIAELIVCSRHFNTADRTARRFGARAVQWDDGMDALAQVDIVIGCTGAPQPVLTRERVAKAMRRRRKGALFLIDIAVPRDIEPGVHDIENVYLYDIDALEGVIDENLEQRRRAAASAEKVIESEVQAFDRWRQTQAIAPLILDLRDSVFETAERELERFLHRAAPLSEPTEQAVRQLARSLARKFVDRPTRYLRDSAERGDAGRVARLFQDIFELKKREAPEGEDEADTRSMGPRRALRGGREDP